MSTNPILKIAAAALLTVVGCAGESNKGPDGAEIAGRRWAVGDSFVYDVQSTRTVSMGQFSSRFDGVLAVTVVGEDADGAYQLRGDVRSPHYQQTPAQDLGGELGRPFFFTVLPTGQVKSFLFEDGVSSGAASVQRELALSLQLVLASDADAASPVWHSVEHDATGEYDAAYSKSGSKIHKSKVKYIAKAGAKGTSPIPGFDGFTVASSADFTLDGSRWPATVLEEESATATAGQLVVTSTKTSSARLVAVEQKPGLVGSMDTPHLVPDTVIDAQARALARIQAAQNLVAGKSYDDIAADLSADDAMTRNHAQARLAALLRLDPSAVQSARAEVLSGKGDINARKRLIGALGTAGTRDSQHALVTLLGERDLPASRAIDVLIALGLTKEPSAETALAVRGAMESADHAIASTATLATGSLIRAMAIHGAGDTAEAMTALTLGLARAASGEERVLHLEALGNTGDARALAAIQPYLADEDVHVRAAAVHGMRFMAGDAADRAVVAGLSDPEHEVQKAAASTLAHRPIAPVLSAVKALLDADTDRTVRSAALGGLRARQQELSGLAGEGATEEMRLTARALLEAK